MIDVKKRKKKREREKDFEERQRIDGEKQLDIMVFIQCYST
jgi:hypothetical protein